MASGTRISNSSFRSGYRLMRGCMFPSICSFYSVIKPKQCIKPKRIDILFKPNPIFVYSFFPDTHLWKTVSLRQFRSSPTTLAHHTIHDKCSAFRNFGNHKLLKTNRLVFTKNSLALNREKIYRNGFRESHSLWKSSSKPVRTNFQRNGFNGQYEQFTERQGFAVAAAGSVPGVPAQQVHKTGHRLQIRPSAR